MGNVSAVDVGIDVGSTTTKICALDAKSNNLLHTSYERHGARQAESVRAALNSLAKLFPRTDIRLALTGSGAAPIADKLGVERDDVENHGKLVEHLWEHFYEDKLYEPTFVRDFPVETSPLVKGHRTKPGVVEKWDLYVRGFELATG